MEVRRALLLFAIVLGLAALASALANPRSGDDAEQVETVADPPPAGSDENPSVSAQPESRTAELALAAGGELERPRVSAGRPAVIAVAVPSAGRVDVPALGLTAPADLLTPARFDLYPREAGTLEVTYTPAGSTAPERVAIIRVRE